MKEYPLMALEVSEWGVLPYDQALSRQKNLVEKRMSGQAPDRLVFVEHPAVVTMGRSAGADDLCVSEATLRQKGIQVCFTDRGGETTFHNPGQMVAYPIIRLKKRDLHWYVRTLLEAVAAVLRDYGLEPVLKEGSPGIWAGGAKIASIGISVKKWITYHGIALNVNNDLRSFNWIVPCGNPHEIITSMEKELGRPLDLAAIKDRFLQKFRKHFGYADCNEGKLPHWLKLRAHNSEAVAPVEQIIENMQLGTVCRSAQCPNIGECFSLGTATFMILGGRCTRNCRFCAVDKGLPEKVDTGEPERVARAVQELDLKYVVITSVTRDDLADGGAGQFVRTIASIRSLCPGTMIEILVPDFKGSQTALKKVCKAEPDMFNHNIETVPRLYSLVRPQAQFERSLNVLAVAAEQGLPVKSGLMLGLGERPEEIKETLAELRQVGCDYLTMGQYLAPSPAHVPVASYIPPDEFDEWAEISKSMGFKGVAAGPLVRSSYKADEMLRAGSNPTKCTTMVLN